MSASAKLASTPLQLGHKYPILGLSENGFILFRELHKKDDPLAMLV